MSDAQLRWLHYNRGEPGRRPEPPFETGRTERRKRWEAARRGRTVSAGEVIREVVEEQKKLSDRQRRVMSILMEEGGRTLLDHVVATSVRRGVLRIDVRDPAVVYGLRLQWEQRVLAAMREKAPEFGVQILRFAVDRMGKDTAF